MHANARPTFSADDRYRIKKRSPEALAQSPKLGAATSTPLRAVSPMGDFVSSLNHYSEEMEVVMGEGDEGDGPRRLLCSGCGETGGRHSYGREFLLECAGDCGRAYHPKCAGLVSGHDLSMLHEMIRRDGKWECSQCRSGKATCMICHDEGFVNGSEGGLIRCGVPGCGRAYHLSCLPAKDAAIGSGFRCAAHECSMCSEPEGARQRRRLLQCWCCPRSFCDRASCRPSKIVRLSHGFILCDPSRRCAFQDLQGPSIAMNFPGLPWPSLAVPGRPWASMAFHDLP